LSERTDQEIEVANLLKGETYAGLIERLAQLGVDEKEVNVRNKLSRGKFTAAFLLQCLSAIGSQQLHLD
jgi:hypothetical protein